MRRPKYYRKGFALLLALTGFAVLDWGVLELYQFPQEEQQLDLVSHVFRASPMTYADHLQLGLERRSFCEGRLVAYGRHFAQLRSVLIDRRHCRSERQGGEAIAAVINQPESSEYYRFDRGCFQLACTSGDKLDYVFAGKKNHLNDWLRSVQLAGDDVAHDDVNTRRRFTIAVTRYEYANLYHTMTDWYNAFLLLCFFNQTAQSTDILFIDSHPSGALDPVWRRLFRRTLRLSDLAADRPTSFDNLVWGWLGYSSFMTIFQSSPTPPLVEEFRSFFLSAYNLPSSTSGRPDCSVRLSVLFIWRRDYVAHPRNPQGSVTRKIANEDKLLRQVQSMLPQSRVTGVQIDLYTMKDQLRIIADTDILIGKNTLLNLKEMMKLKKLVQL